MAYGQEEHIRFLFQQKDAEPFETLSTQLESPLRASIHNLLLLLTNQYIQNNKPSNSY